ncbi:MAG: HAD family hydrolase [Paracoccaceae bacterium]
MEPAAYLFDMDGLLLDSERLARESFVHVAQANGLPGDDAAQFFLTLIGTSSKEGTRRTLAYLPEHLDVVAFEDQWRDHYEAAIKRGVPVRPTVLEALERLSGQGARMAVVTSTRGERARRKLQIAGIFDHFEFVLGGDEVSANKPDPAPYLEAAARINLPAAQCAAFEDSDLGTAAAVASGARVVQVPDLRPEGVPLPDLGQLIAASLAEAVALVDMKVGA